MSLTVRPIETQRREAVAKLLAEFTLALSSRLGALYVSCEARRGLGGCSRRSCGGWGEVGGGGQGGGCDERVSMCGDRCLERHVRRVDSPRWSPRDHRAQSGRHRA